MIFTDPPKGARLTDAQLKTLAAEAGIGYPELKAVSLVESGPLGGFIKIKNAGQVPFHPVTDPPASVPAPVILLERHYVWKRLTSRNIDPHPLATSLPNVCGRSWAPKVYKYGTTAGQWARVQSIIAWAARHWPSQVESYRKAAWESCSWGRFQLMGANFAAAGFENVDLFARAHAESELEQTRAILRWMAAGGLLRYLKAHRWAEFARRYNGSGQVDFYAGRLEAAFLRAQKHG